MSEEKKNNAEWVIDEVPTQTAPVLKKGDVVLDGIQAQAYIINKLDKIDKSLNS